MLCSSNMKKQNEKPEIPELQSIDTNELDAVLGGCACGCPEGQCDGSCPCQQGAGGAWQ